MENIKLQIREKAAREKIETPQSHNKGEKKQLYRPD